MEVVMGFKHSDTQFGRKSQFQNEMKRFICDEAARFTTEGNEAASATMDEFAEKTVRFSAERNKENIKIQKQILNDIPKMDEKENYKTEKVDQAGKGEKHDKTINDKKESAKKEKAKETKKLGVKTAVASMFKAKKDLSNDLVSEKVTGDAFKDGLSGFMQTVAEFINPMRWVKGLVMKLAAVIAPYIAVFMMIATIVIIVVMLLFSILQPLADVGEAITNFLSFFSEGSDDFINVSLADEEIQSIIEESGCDETQELAIRYALEKVGYPYSQELRTSGTAYDCSSLVYYCWINAGVDISYGTNYPPTAAAGAKMLSQDGKELDILELQSGDIVYYGGNSNDRYLGIYHVAIYIGNGMAVEAMNPQYGVVYHRLQAENAIMVCRPNK